MFHFVRRVVAALLNRFKPFSPPTDPYAAVREPGGAIRRAEVPLLLYKSRSPKNA